MIGALDRTDAANTEKGTREKSESEMTMRQAAATSTQSVPPRACGHERHRGWCPCCQSQQQQRWAAQLASATPTAAPVRQPIAA